MPRPRNGRHYELSEGELIVVGNTLARRELVKRRILKALFSWEIRYSAGAVFSESQFTLGDATARIPDVAYIRNAKLESLPDADVPIPFAPDLAVEVISESESAFDAERKVGEYLRGGTLEVWQVYPNERRVRVRTAEGIRDLGPSDLLTSPLAPGFEVLVESFFGR
jgi:Uma2 family endonuclease